MREMKVPSLLGSVSTERFYLPEDLFNAERIPTSLRIVKRWTCRKPLLRQGKWTKVPVDPHTLGAGSSTNSAKWASFDEVTAAASKHRNLGIGFVLGDEFAGIDIDECVDAMGTINPQASQIVEDLDTYSEFSISGAGVHCMFRGKLPPGRWRVACEGLALEMYDAGRFFTVTGNALNNKEVGERSAQAAAIHARYFGVPRPSRVAIMSNPNGPAPSPISDAGLLECIQKSRQGAKFDGLWAGDTSDYGGDESRADQALCNILAFWTSRDPARIDELFRQSGLMREKWNREDYSRRTIQRAIDSCPESWIARASDVYRTPRPPLLPLSKRDLPFTDLGNAERLRNRHGGDLRYCSNNG